MWHFYNLEEQKNTTDKESVRAATLLDAQNFLEMPLNEAPPSNDNVSDWAFEYFENPKRFNPFIAYYF